MTLKMWTDRAHVLYDMVGSARQRVALQATPIADSIAEGHEVWRNDVKRYRWARDCERVAWVMWHLEVYGAFPEFWNAAPVAAPAVSITPAAGTVEVSP